MGKNNKKKLTLAKKYIVMDVSFTIVAFFNKDKNANVRPVWCMSTMCDKTKSRRNFLSVTIVSSQSIFNGSKNS